MATEIGHRVADLADSLDSQDKPAFANELRKSSFRVSGILAEGSSCPTKPEFAEFVAHARAATLEIANLVIFFSERELISEDEEANLVNMLKRESKMLENFRQSLERAPRPEPIVA